MFRKIVDWMRTPEGKEYVAGIIFGALGIFVVRIFCFLVCLVTGYPANIWNIFG
jgi:preprotein translocase subunit Sss1|nr:MAG TPA: Preprotein translocase subunit secY, Preprotein Transport, Membrane Protein Complex.9A [Caudoviricetes sp.]